MRVARDASGNAEANSNAVGCNAKVSLHEQKDTSLYLRHQIYGLFAYSISASTFTNSGSSSRDGLITSHYSIMLYSPSDTTSFSLSSESSRHHNPPSVAHAAALSAIPPDLWWLLNLLRHRLSYNGPSLSRTSLAVLSHGSAVSAISLATFYWINDA